MSDQPPAGAESAGPAAPPPAGPAAPPAGPGVPPAGQPRRSRWPSIRRGLLLGGTISLIVICAIVVLVVVGWSIGVDALVIGLAAAIIPVPVLVLAFLWLDRYEPKPIHFLIFCFGWGAFVATAVALGVNTAASVLFEQIGLAEELVAVLVAPVIEEVGKVAAPLLLWLVRRRALSGIIDGIVYCGLAATGFAMVENILYLGGAGWRAGVEEAGPATGLLQLLVLFAARILMSGFAHPLFTAAAGVGLGIAARSRSRAVRWLAPLAGLLVAMLLHAAWNTMAVLTGVLGEPLLFVYGYVAVMMPIFLGMVGLAIWLRAREGQLTQRTLPAYVRAGWLSPPELASLRSLGTRHSARTWAKRVAGEPGARQMRRFQDAATRLALLRDRMVRGLDRSGADRQQSLAEESALLSVIAEARTGYVGRDPVVPPARWDGHRYTITFPDGVPRRVPEPPEPAVPLPVRLPPVHTGASAPPPAITGPHRPPPYGAGPPQPPYAGPHRPPPYGAGPPQPPYRPERGDHGPQR